MYFNSYLFVLCFLPLTVAGFHIAAKHSLKLAKLFLIAASLLFYAYAGIPYLLLLMCSVAANYSFAFLMLRQQAQAAKFSRRKLWLCAGVGFNLLLLVYFKYMDFFFASANAAFQKDWTILHIALPLGISFYTFEAIGFLADLYRGEIFDDSIAMSSYVRLHFRENSGTDGTALGKLSFLDFSLFMLYFPKIAQGPIVGYREFYTEFYAGLQAKSRFEITTGFESQPESQLPAELRHAQPMQPIRWEGLIRFTLGLSKKLLLADVLGRAVNWTYAHDEKATVLEWFLMLFFYALELYFDFSAYCDMASGVSLLLGIRLPENFDSPYKARSIPEFWRRWHRTLTRFLQKNVYFPLGGSRGGNLQTYRNILIVFLLSGLWHGANWTFVLWGLLHGIANALTRACRKPYEKLWSGAQWLLTQSFVAFAWLLFRAESVHQAGHILKRMVGFLLRPEKTELQLHQEFLEAFHSPLLSMLTARFMEIKSFVPAQGALSAWYEKMPGIVQATSSWTGTAATDLWYELGMMLLMLCGTLYLVTRCRNTAEIRYSLTPATAVGTGVLLFWDVLSLSAVSTFLYFGF